MAEKSSLSFEQFQVFLAENLNVASDSLVPEAMLLNDLAVDSIKLVELVLRMESQLGVTVPPEAAWEIQTIDDAYQYCARQLSEGTAS